MTQGAHAALVGTFMLSAGLHGAAIGFVRSRPESAPPATASEMLVETDVEQGSAAASVEDERSQPSPHGGTVTLPATARRTTELAAADEATRERATPANAADDQRRSELRAAVERAMLAHPDPTDSPASGVSGSQETGRSGGGDLGVGYLSGWFSALVSVHSLRLTAQERAQATALAVIVVADGVISAASISQPGPVDEYNRALSSALATLVGRAVPPNSADQIPSGVFTLRLRPR